jgi:glutathione synthase
MRANKRLGVVMDSIATIHFHKDTTLGLLLEAKQRGFSLYYFELRDLLLSDGQPYGVAKPLDVFLDEKHYYDLGDAAVMSLAEMSLILMRKDPPFDEAYYYATHLLERAEMLGVTVWNRPHALREHNEKLLATQFPDCAPESLVTQSTHLLHEFRKAHAEIVCKPLGGMAGQSVFHIKSNDPNAQVIFETLTAGETRYVMAQVFIPAIKQGDKRILMVHGKAISHALARVPQGDEWRGNLAVGAKGVVQPLSVRDHEIAERVGPFLREAGIYFAGIDVIGDYLTEINITSPTGMREIEKATGINIAAKLYEGL